MKSLCEFLLLFTCVVSLSEGTQKHHKKYGGDIQEGDNVYVDIDGNTAGRPPILSKYMLQKSVAEQALENQLWGQFEDDAATKAAAILSDELSQNATDFNVSERCFEHTKLFLSGLVSGETWALRMLDAMGKPPSGLMDFNVKWLGNWGECKDVVATVYDKPTTQEGPSNPFVGKYCLANFKLKMGINTALTPLAALLVGFCFADSCSSEDATQMMSAIVGLLPVNITSQIGETTVTCQENHLELTTSATIAIVICSIFVALMVIATAFDIYIQHIRGWASSRETSEPMTNGKYKPKNAYEPDNTPSVVFVENGVNGVNGMNGHTLHDTKKPDVEMEADHSYKPGIPGKLLLAFSVYTNGQKILNMNQPAGTLSCVNGIRLLSMTWVIMGHSYSMNLQMLDNVVSVYQTMMTRFTFQAIANATYSVDTFFVLSGLLVSYLSLRELKKVGGAKRFNWLLFYFHRFWRLTPVYMLTLMLSATLSRYWGDGPVWNQQGNEINECKDTWWRNLLYINNFFPISEMCFGWSWYLANDMQFYVLSPLMLIPFFYSKIVGSIVCFLLLVGTMVTRGYLAHVYNAPGNMILAENQLEIMDKLYMAPWCRIGPYVVGVFTGYLLYKTNCKVKIGKIYNMIGWAIATAVAIMIIYGLYTPDGSPKLSHNAAVVYNATARTAWGMCVAWVIFSCATGHGGPVNGILSWSILIPLSRLTYCAYLVHLLVMYVYGSSQRIVGHGYDLGMIYDYVANLCLSYGVAFIVSLAFESPMMGIEKALLGRKKHS